MNVCSLLHVKVNVIAEQISINIKITDKIGPFSN